MVVCWFGLGQNKIDTLQVVSISGDLDCEKLVHVFMDARSGGQRGQLPPPKKIMIEGAGYAFCPPPQKKKCKLFEWLDIII